VSETRRKVHLIGHSLGGVIAHAVAVQRPHDIASVITLGSPVRGVVVHPSIWNAAEKVRNGILQRHGSAVSSKCYTPHCTCDFSRSLRRRLSPAVAATAIYTRDDGVVDWRYCRTGDSGTDFEVHGTHLGLPFNASAYGIIATRLAEAQAPRSRRRTSGGAKTRSNKRLSRIANLARAVKARPKAASTLPLPAPVSEPPTLDSPQETLPVRTNLSAGAIPDRVAVSFPVSAREDSSNMASLASGRREFRGAEVVPGRRWRAAISAAGRWASRFAAASKLRLRRLWAVLF
jgi:pimeloyl-ACP methyl ester carboxylesterase